VVRHLGPPLLSGGLRAVAVQGSIPSPNVFPPLLQTPDVSAGPGMLFPPLVVNISEPLSCGLNGAEESRIVITGELFGMMPVPGGLWLQAQRCCCVTDNPGGSVGGGGRHKRAQHSFLFLSILFCSSVYVDWKSQKVQGFPFLVNIFIAIAQ